MLKKFKEDKALAPILLGGGVVQPDICLCLDLFGLFQPDLFQCKVSKKPIQFYFVEDTVQV